MGGGFTVEGLLGQNGGEKKIEETGVFHGD